MPSRSRAVTFVEAEIQAAFDRLGTVIAGMEARLSTELCRAESRVTAQLGRVDCKVDRVETALRALIEQDVIPKIEPVAEVLPPHGSKRSGD